MKRYETVLIRDLGTNFACESNGLFVSDAPADVKEKLRSIANENPGHPFLSGYVKLPFDPDNEDAWADISKVIITLNRCGFSFKGFITSSHTSEKIERHGVDSEIHSTVGYYIFEKEIDE